jgi:hypothetical protein
MVFGRFVIFSNTHSKNTHDATHTITTTAARAPKMSIDAMNAGTSAIITSSIILVVVVLS